MYLELSGEEYSRLTATLFIASTNLENHEPHGVCGACGRTLGHTAYSIPSCPTCDQAWRFVTNLTSAEDIDYQAYCTAAMRSLTYVLRSEILSSDVTPYPEYLRDAIIR